MDKNISRILEISGQPAAAAPDGAPQRAATTGIDRREAIKRVTVLLGGFALASSGLLTAVERAHARAAVTRHVGDFTAQDVALLDEVADTILPDTKTPGAKAAHTGPFMALMVTDAYDDQQQAIFRDGLQKLNGMGFMAKTPAERLALLQQLDTEQNSYPKTKAPDAPPHYFRLMKELAVVGYFTSEIGCTQAQRYQETPGRYDPCIPYTAGESAWAGHA